MNSIIRHGSRSRQAPDNKENDPTVRGELALDDIKAKAQAIRAKAQGLKIQAQELRSQAEGKDGSVSASLEGSLRDIRDGRNIAERCLAERQMDAKQQVWMSQEELAWKRWEEEEEAASSARSLEEESEDVCVEQKELAWRRQSVEAEEEAAAQRARLEEEEEAARLEQEELAWRRQEEMEAQDARPGEEEEEAAARLEQEELAWRRMEEEEEAHRARLEAAADPDRQAVSMFLLFSGFRAQVEDGTNEPPLPVNARKRSGLLGSTYPLHVAVKKKDATMVQLLLAYGANAAQQDSSGKTPLALAERLARFGESPAANDVLEVLRGHHAQ